MLETSDAIELGAKSTLWDDRATLNIALYYQKFDGYLGFTRGVQVLDNAGEPVDLPGGFVYNGDANIWGIEFEGKVYLRGLFKYTDDRLITDASAGIGNVRREVSSYQTLDLFTGLRSNDFAWDVSLWVKNVTDEDEVIYQQGPDQYDIALSGGSYTQTNILRERTFGMTARYNF